MTTFMSVKALANIDGLASDFPAAHITDPCSIDLHAAVVHRYGPISIASNFFLASDTPSCSFTISTWMS
jgi:hypothetical protein